MPQPDLFDIGSPEAPPRPLELVTSGAECAVLLGGRPFLSFPRADGTARRHAAVVLFQGRHATHAEIAAAWGVTSRSVRNWTAWYREKGISGLADGRGRPLIVTEEVKRQIAALRALRVDTNTIARRLGISKTAVRRALRAGRSLGQPSLAFADETSEPAECQQDASEDAPEARTVTDEAHEAAECEQDASSDVPEARAEERDDEELDRLSGDGGDGSGDASVPSAAAVADPLDRSQDRALARLGILSDAPPAFAPCGRADFAGSFLAMALLGRDSFLAEVQAVYRDMGAAFYGLRAVFATLFLMAVLRIKTVERMDRCNVLRLGRILGLDRSPCVRTIRRKIKHLCFRGRAMELMERIGRKRFLAAGLPDAVLFVDGHVKCYYGKGRLGKTFSTALNSIVAGCTDYWINLADGTPLLCIPTEFNDGMAARMADILKHASRLCGGRRITVVFDRGGSSAACYESIIQAGCDLIAYHMHPAPADDARFGTEPTTINGKTYLRSPYERDIELAVRERMRNGKYRDTGRAVRLREVLVPRDKGGFTSVVTTRRDLSMEDVAGLIFGRWTQENYLKYAVHEYNLDHLCVHATEPVSPEIEHPNPEYVQTQKTIKAIRKRIARIVGADLDGMTDPELYNPQERFECMHARQGKQLRELGEALRNAHGLLATLPPRVSAGEYERLPSESRMLSNIVKMTAYHVEGQLAEIVAAHWGGTNGNERGLVAGFMESAGAIEVTDTLLKITLERQATPQKTELLARLCDDLTVCRTTYPGTDLRMVFQVAR